MSKSRYVVGLFCPRHQLKVGPGDIRQAGSALPEADRWKSGVLQSHLNIGYVMERFEFAKKLQEHKRNLPDSLIKEFEANLGYGQEQEPAPVEKAPEQEEEVEEEEAEEEEGEEVVGELSELNSKQLQDLCKERGLATKGNKRTLIERLMRAEAQ